MKHFQLLEMLKAHILRMQVCILQLLFCVPKYLFFYTSMSHLDIFAGDVKLRYVLHTFGIILKSN
jgi:hypothetical protein